jgi:hypothetical protein
MVRAIVSVIVGFLVCAFLVIASFALAQAMLGPDWLFRPNSFEPSKRWLLVSFVLSLLAAIVGGLLCGAMSKKRGAVQSLAIVFLVLGAATAATEYALAPTDAPPPRTPDMTFAEIAQQARQPLWVALVTPVIGAVGALVGGGIALRRRGADR